MHAAILFKGHSKDKTLANSYRTISTFPLVAEALDSYIHELNIDHWDNDQASTQFLGQGSSHELAALLLTELTQYFIVVFIILFHFFSFSVTIFSYRMATRIKNLLKPKLYTAPSKLLLGPFPDPISHFGAPGGEFLNSK